MKLNLTPKSALKTSELTCKDDFGLVFGNPLHAVRPFTGQFAGGLASLDT